MRSYAFAPPADSGPIATINTTPMIDVMLVLLVMMILTLPKVTHKLPVDLPGPSANAGPPPPVDRIDLSSNGALSWNGVSLSSHDLDAKLKAHVGDQRMPVLHLATAPEARYDRFNAMLSQVKRAGVTRLGFVGNDPHPSW